MGQTNVSVTSVLRQMFISLWGISLLKHWVFVGKLWKRIEIGPTGDSTCWQRSYLDNVSLQLCVMSGNSSKRKNEQDPTDTFPEQGEGVTTEVWSLSVHQMCKGGANAAGCPTLPGTNGNKAVGQNSERCSRQSVCPHTCSKLPPLPHQNTVSRGHSYMRPFDKSEVSKAAHPTNDFSSKTTTTD